MIVEDLYAHIKAEGGTAGMVGRMQTREQLYEIIDYHAYEALDAGIAKSVLPKDGE